MKVKLAATVLTLILCGSNTIGGNEVLQEGIRQGDHCTISWAQIPAPEK